MSILNAGHILESINGRSATHLESLEVFDEIDSTNNYMLELPPPSAGNYRVALAEHQTAGRGRHGRSWQSPRESGIYLSISYTFAETPEHLSSLTLAVGIGVAQTLEQLGVRRVALKWPNDIVVGNGKAGGILTEVVAGSIHGTTVVVGIGLNVDFSHSVNTIAVSGAFEKATDLKSCTTDLPDHSTISVALINSLFDSMVRFDAEGFTRFIEAWSRLDWLHGQKILVQDVGGELSGLAHGIDDDGALMVNTGDGNRRVLSGNISLLR